RIGRCWRQEPAFRTCDAAGPGHRGDRCRRNTTVIRRIHGLPLGSSVLAVVLIVTVAAHVGAWYFISQHLAFSGAVASALIALAVIKHLRWLGAAYALLRRRRAPPK